MGDTSKKLFSYPAPVTHFNTQRDFIQTLWSSAKQAAKLIGVHPAVLLAQAALETNWGKKIIGHADGASTHNLFNIKSDPASSLNSATTTTLEQKNGVLVKETAHFRSYRSFDESFTDYANMIKFNSRYKKAVENAEAPAAYTKSPARSRLCNRLALL